MNNNSIFIYIATIFAHDYVSIDVAWVTFMQSLCSDAAWDRGIYSACWGCGLGSPAVVLCSQFYLGTNRSQYSLSRFEKAELKVFVHCYFHVFYSTQTTDVTAAVVLRAFWTQMNVIKTLVSAPAWLVILVYSVRTARMDSLPTVPAAVWPVHVTLLERYTCSVTGQLFSDSHVV